MCERESRKERATAAHEQYCTCQWPSQDQQTVWPVKIDGNKPFLCWTVTQFIATLRLQWDYFREAAPMSPVVLYINAKNGTKLWKIQKPRSGRLSWSSGTLNANSMLHEERSSANSTKHRPSWKKDTHSGCHEIPRQWFQPWASLIILHSRALFLRPV
jgi:hypothetical protein